MSAIACRVERKNRSRRNQWDAESEVRKLGGEKEKTEAENRINLANKQM